MDKLKYKILGLQLEIKAFLMRHIEEWKVEKVGGHVTEFRYKDIYFEVWSANELEDRRFYESVLGVDMEGLEYSTEECEQLQKALESAQIETGNVR
jgi:hypothetical protein